MKWSSWIWPIFTFKHTVHESMMQKFFHSTHASPRVSLTRLGGSTSSNTNQVCLDLHICPLVNLYPPGFLFFTLWNINLNNLVSLWLDLNSLTCFSLLDTVNLIGQECMLGMPNHRASPRSLPTNGRRKMVSVISLSLREGGNKPPGPVGTFMLRSGQSLYVWEAEGGPKNQAPLIRSCTLNTRVTVIDAAHVTDMNGLICESHRPAWRWCVSLATSSICGKKLRLMERSAYSTPPWQPCGPGLTPSRGLSLFRLLLLL